jgi:hypothetical protein
MAHTLQSFASRCSSILKAEPGPEGRRKVCTLLEEALKDERFVAENITEATPERQVIYEDPELGFCILAHRYEGQKSNVPPHDHGPSWAIYGQAKGETLMTDYSLVEAATPEKPGKARATRNYSITPGMAHLYNEGELHAPTRLAPTRLIRIEGTNMDRIKRLKFEKVA